jgi:hypothetical protein
MANSSTPFGFKLRADLMGYQPSLLRVQIPSSDGTAVFVGDAVKIHGNAGGQYSSCPTVIQAAATDPIFGVVVGIDQVDGVADANFSLYRLHRPASVAMFAYICTDPNAIYEIQEDAVGGALAAADIGLNAEIVVGSGDTVTGLSGMQLDTSTKQTTATLVLKTLGFVPRLDNEPGSANAKVLVKINNHQLGSHTGTAGV